MQLWRCLPAAALFVVSGGLAQAQVTEDSFLLRDTGDLVALCTDTQSDRLYTAASNFCEGFAVGEFRVLQEEEQARRMRHMFCLAEPLPSRNEGIARFVAWAKADASRMTLPPTDAFATFLAQQFPCPRGR